MYGESKSGLSGVSNTIKKHLYTYLLYFSVDSEKVKKSEEFTGGQVWINNDNNLILEN